MSETILKCENLTKKIGKKTIVKDITFDIKEGEILGFIGPNGSGKSTTIKMILGLISINSGKAYICGHDIEKDFEKAIKEVGSVVENPDMYMYLSGYDNLKLYANMYGNISKQRIDEVVKIVGLENRINDKISKYSLGMKQRLGIAQALLHDPKLLILDEPTNGLDPMGMKELRDLLTDLAKKENMAIFISSHILSEIESFCTKLCIIQNGKIIENTSMKHFKESLSGTGNTDIYTFRISDVKKAVKVLDKEMINLQSEKELKLNVGEDGVTDIIKQLLEEDIKIYEVIKDIVSLEEAFIKKTGGNKID